MSYTLFLVTLQTESLNVMKRTARTGQKLPVTKHKSGRTGVRLPILPVLPILFVLTYVWAAWYYGDVLRMARERSFWVAAADQMDFLLGKEFGGLWYIGRMGLQLFRYPWLGGLVLALSVSVGTWCVGYSMRLSAKWRWLQYVPAGAYMMYIAYEGINWFHENEGGIILGIPFCAVLILLIWTALIASFSRKRMPALIGIPKDETRWQNGAQLLMLVAIFGTQVAWTELARPYTRVIARENVCLLNNDWKGVMEVARENADISHRPIAAMYAIALVETEQIADRMYDIRLDYDSLYLHSQSGEHSLSLNLYQEDCDYYAGFIETCIHHAIERMTMIGPNIHSLELLTKCSILRGETEAAYKYLRILDGVPFEGKFVKKYTAYVGDSAMVADDPEMALIRKLEPIHDSFENNYQQPTFMGYNLALVEGRSKNALLNSLACCMYTKVMPAFIMRTAPLEGQTPPENVCDALCLMSSKDPGIMKRFNGLDLHYSLMTSRIAEMKPYMKDRQRYARELFPRFKGYYPYYYFFGNLKATKKRSESASSSAGVN